MDKKEIKRRKRIDYRDRWWVDIINYEMEEFIKNGLQNRLNSVYPKMRGIKKVMKNYRVDFRIMANRIFKY